MLCLSDNDIVLKLAEFDLLKESLEVLSVKKNEVYVLPTALRVVTTSKLIAANHTRDAIDRAAKFLKSVQVIANADATEVGALLSVPMIDPGEATIFAATKGLAAYLVATGDKRSLRAIAAAGGPCTNIAARLHGRVICLEQILVRLITHLGYAAVQKKVGRCVGDTCVDHAFAGGKPSHPQAECLRWLTEYIDELRKETGPLLVA